MPIYEYECQKCGHEFEREQRIIEDAIKKCPECKANKAKRLISKTSFVLKGSGWYGDLYSSAKPDKDSSSDENTDSKKSDEKKTDDSKKSDEKKTDDSKKSDSQSDKKKKDGKAKKKSAA